MKLPSLITLVSGLLVLLAGIAVLGEATSWFELFDRRIYNPLLIAGMAGGALAGILQMRQRSHE